MGGHTSEVAQGDEDKDGGQHRQNRVQLQRFCPRQRQRVAPHPQGWPCLPPHPATDQQATVGKLRQALPVCACCIIRSSDS